MQDDKGILCRSCDVKWLEALEGCSYVRDTAWQYQFLSPFSLSLSLPTYALELVLAIV